MAKDRTSKLASKYRSYGLQRVAKALYDQHSFDPEIAYVMAWLVVARNKDKAPSSVGFDRYIKRYDKITNCPVITDEDAKTFVRLYTKMNKGDNNNGT